MLLTESDIKKSPSINLDGPIPEHVGIIMDGNGRWAKKRGLPRTAGHKEGLTAAKRVVKAAKDLGVKYLSLYTFSTENWKRAAGEVNFLMDLLKVYLRKEMDFYRKNGIRIIHTGDLAGLPAIVQKEITDMIEATKHFESLVVNLAINYGGQDELYRAIKSYLSFMISEGKDIQEVLDDLENNDHDLINSFIDAPELPPVDLIIRSGGEQRLSNFLLWRSSYAELFFSQRLWPDWTDKDFQNAIQAFQERHRKFGGDG
jgi:undecaprenyl diphosphate synthase